MKAKERGIATIIAISIAAFTMIAGLVFEDKTHVVHKVLHKAKKINDCVHDKTKDK